ncbi:MAG: GGDEF domain-containing protein [Smithella sp.]|jgi:diguanylate cyclase (GGDEF)-like protein
MPSKKEHDIVDELSKLLLDITMLGNPPHVPARFASVDSLQTLYANLISLRDFLYAASNGDLSRQVSFKGYIGGALKTLQSNLRHITWQTKMVASGDFTQRVEFMGEFSQSFNAMVIQLDQTLNELVRKDTELSKVNDDLLKEIDSRKQTEIALRESEEAMRLLAITDSLTGLYNRMHFFELAENEFSRSLRYSRPLSVMMFDIDFFKRINDTFGHTSGDMVLKMVATTTKETVRTTDIPARYGGEEFVILLPETSVAEAAIVAEKLRRKIEDSTVQAEKCRITITASFGVSDYLGQTNSKPHTRVLSEFVSNADLAMYASKNAGRNRVTVYKPEEESLP